MSRGSISRPGPQSRSSRNTTPGGRSATSTGFIAPWLPASEQVALRQDRDQNSGVRAWLTPNVRVDIAECDGSWCEVSATSHPKEGSARTYRGYVQESELWGVYKDEKFD
jgi:SH3-like domain-containing protein